MNLESYQSFGANFCYKKCKKLQFIRNLTWFFFLQQKPYFFANTGKAAKEGLGY